jgi:cation transport ATPase
MADQGASAVDESMVTGEPTRSKRNPATAGFRPVDRTGGFIMRAERVGSDTLGSLRSSAW